MSREPASTADANAPGFTFTGSFPPRHIPLAYRGGLLLSAFTIVLLPLIYIGLIIATGYGVYLYAIHGTVIFEGRSGGVGRLVAYAGPLFAGAVLIVFLIKPLFARDAKHAEPLSLDLEKEPRLRAFIAEICRLVGAPMPVRVDLDSQVNASARYRRGLFSLGRHDLVLTIGMPLAAGLSARQFAGVLAHEFGHFAQGAGMAATYIIRSVNNWFARVVFGRDSWDASLESWSRGADFRIAAILWLARGGVWLSRKILHGLMYVAHAITCFQLRQMEFDADYYETQLAGSTAFAETSRELRRLNVAGQSAFNELGSLWSERRLVDDFSGFVALRRAQLPDDLLAKIDGSAADAKTRWSDTHPADAERIAHAHSLGSDGVFQGEGPASALFTDFAATSRAVTKHYYREQLELKLSDNALISVSAAAKTGDAATAASEACERLTRSVLNLQRIATWPTPIWLSLSPELTTVELAGQLSALRGELARLHHAAQTAEKAYQRIDGERTNAAIAWAFLDAGVKVKSEAFGLIRGELTEAAIARDRLTKQRDARAAELAPFENTLWRYLELIGRAARTPAMVAGLSTDWAPRITAVTDALDGLRPWFRAFPAWLEDHRILSAFAANQQSLAENTLFNAAVSSRLARLRQTAAQAPELAGQILYPLTQDGTPIPARQLMEKAVEGVHPDGHFEATLRTTVSCFFRLIGELALAGEQLEKALSTEPAPAAPAAP
jgi:Zn-dependent protease with chaperone function